MKTEKREDAVRKAYILVISSLDEIESKAAIKGIKRYQRRSVEKENTKH